MNQPGPVAAGDVLDSIRVELRDDAGRRVSGAQASITLSLGANPGGAVLAGTKTRNALNGVATFGDLSLERAAAGYTLTASASGLDPVTSRPFTVTPATVVLAFLTQPGAAEGQVPFTPAVRVRAAEDRFGNAVTGAAVSMSLAVSPSGDTLSGIRTVTAVNGVATFADLSLALPGDGFVLQARSGDAASVSSAVFSVRLTFAQLSAGGSYSCGVTIAGYAYCWGFNLDPVFGGGMLGDGTTMRRLTPTPVKGGLRFAQVSAGSVHTCGVTTGGDAYCWGSNSVGGLGDGTTTQRLTPTRVSGGLKFAEVSSGQFHTCGVTTTQLAFCWGYNSHGELGEGSTSHRARPEPVSGGLSFIQLSPGNAHTCGVTTDHVAYCWGRNGDGELGDGTTTERVVPTQVAGGLSFAQVSVGIVHTCGVTTDRIAYCWGRNGALGDGTMLPRHTPAPVTGALSFVRVTAGAAYSCGLTSAAAAYCWGSNGDGQLGDGTTERRESPTVVAGGLSFTHVRGGGGHTCGVTNGNVAYCWGSNGEGQLGDGTTMQRLIPVRVVQ